MGIKDLIAQSWADDVAGEAARIAFFFFLCLFPALLFLFALTGIMGGPRAFDTVAGALGAVLPGATWQTISGSIRKAITTSSPGVASIGLVLTLWSGSSGVATLSTSLNQMYHTLDERNWFVRRGIAVLVTAVGSLLLMSITAGILATVAAAHARGITIHWGVLRWVLALAAFAAGNWLSYMYLPNRRPPGRERQTLIGAVLATVIWAVATYCLREYLSHTSEISRVYGVLGVPIVLLIWFYISAIAVLVGGELAATLEGGMRNNGTPTQ